MRLYITLNTTHENGLATGLVNAPSRQEAVNKRQRQLAPGLRVVAVSDAVKPNDMGSFFNKVREERVVALKVGDRLKARITLS